MTVKELRKLLKNFPEDSIVVVSADEEGNSFSPLFEVAETMYAAESSHYGQTYVMPEFIGKHGYTEEDRAPEDAVLAVVLWP